MRWVCLTLLAACKFSNNLAGNSGDDVMIDAAIDAPPDAPPDAFDPACFGSGPYYICMSAVPMTDETLDNDDTINTTNCTGGANWSVRMLGQTPVCVVAAGTVSLSSGQVSAVTGMRPLVIIGTTAITIDGNLNVSAVGSPGPGSNPGICSTGNGGTADTDGGSGGAGGSFGGRGGNGGNSDQDGTVVAGAVAAPPVPPSAILRGGCQGGLGPPGNATMVPGGDGGGAVYFASRGTITINGRVNANGDVGNGGTVAFGGGSGGGSGGMIVFHGQTLTIGALARVVANGGGGGGGAGNNDPGDNGIAGDPATPLVPSLGGQAATAGRSQGGNGAAGATNPTKGADGDNGGGGGGGGFGQIRILKGGTAASFPAGTVSPPPTT